MNYEREERNAGSTDEFTEFVVPTLTESPAFDQPRRPEDPVVRAMEASPPEETTRTLGDSFPVQPT